jgi:hypothetical protein
MKLSKNEINKLMVAIAQSAGLPDGERGVELHRICLGVVSDDAEVSKASLAEFAELFSFRSSLTEGAHLQVSQIAGWREAVGPLLAIAMSIPFKKATGVDEIAGEYVTLFFSTLQRVSIVKDLQGGDISDAEIFRTRILPKLQVVDREFKILGTLALPSTIDLAVTDLSKPRAVFTFVTIQKVPYLHSKLRGLGLQDLLLEGQVGTVDGKDWFSDDKAE